MSGMVGRTCSLATRRETGCSASCSGRLLSALRTEHFSLRPKHLHNQQQRWTPYPRRILTTCKVAAKKRPQRQRQPPPFQETLPSPGAYQQTLRKSFTLGGLGLHTAEYAYIRVRPALAGEGRYFVRVPLGTNQSQFVLTEPTQVPLEEFGYEEVDQEEEDAQVQLFLQYLQAQEQEGFEGSFTDFVGDRAALVQDLLADDEPEDVLEEIVPRSEDEPYLLATLDNVSDEQQLYTTLGQGNNSIRSVELLLSVLEACGVDNARIEIEGGSEIPIVDGSALGWAIEIQLAGLRDALQEEGRRVRRVAPQPRDTLTIRGSDGAFVSFIPEPVTRLTCGLDYAKEAPIIGKQWFSWAPRDDQHYRWALAPARTFAPSPQYLIEARDQGFFKGGTEGCAIVGYGDRWYEAQEVRFFDDEPARHEMVDLVGDLSLLATGGHSGLPLGHVVAYKADSSLRIEFARALKASCDEADFTPAEPDNTEEEQEDS